MKLSQNDMKRLRQALRPRRPADLKRAFALIRAHDDSVLLAALKPAPARPSRRRDPLVRELEATLRPIMGPASEKADLLVQHMAARHRRQLAFEPKGLADAARRLRASFSDAQIASAARSLMADLAKLYGGGETVV
jgi:hypothetical protein